LEGHTLSDIFFTRQSGKSSI
jgi:hypothetical protein